MAHHHPPFHPQGTVKELRKLLGRNLSEVASRRASEIVASIIQGKASPREMCPAALPAPQSTRQAPLTVPPTSEVADYLTAPAGASGSKDAPADVPCLPHGGAPHVRGLTTATTQAPTLQPKAIAPLVPKALSAGGGPKRRGSAMAAMMGSAAQRSAPSTLDVAAGVPPCTAAAAPSLTTSQGRPGVTSSAGADLVPAVSAMGSILGGGGMRMRAGGSMAGLGSGSVGAVSQSDPSIEGAAERLERLRASFQLPFVRAPEPPLKGGACSGSMERSLAVESNEEECVGVVGSARGQGRWLRGCGLIILQIRLCICSIIPCCIVPHHPAQT